MIKKGNKEIIYMYIMEEIFAKSNNISLQT